VQISALNLVVGWLTLLNSKGKTETAYYLEKLVFTIKTTGCHNPGD